MPQDDEVTRPQRRSYHAPLRAKAASETRAVILAAATRLFVEHGYANVTVPQIAQLAGTAVPTVYASTGGKGAILTNLIEDGLQRGTADEAIALLRRTDQPTEVIAAAAHGTRVDNERDHGIIRVVVGAAHTDKHAAGALVRVNEGYRGALEAVVERLGELEALRSDLTSDRATDVLWYYLGHHSWHELVVAQGWSWDVTEEWLTNQLRAAVLP
ncbi:TetR/AcrR family transcriptional regulator [Kribbella sp. DT2]|uniref:TetR/AcrR family transcriptional regulator n=1 Tax=Kribbella sp. DT2 TaxID=3393427 RepID=UPI003CE74ECE